MSRTNFRLKCTYILIVCWFLPAWAADTDSIVSLMGICTTVQEHAFNMTADVVIVYVVHRRGVSKYAFLSA